MNPPPSRNNVSDNSPWEWIPTGEFKLPSATIQTTFKTRLMSLLRPKTPSENMEDVLKPESLEFLSTFMLDRLVPNVDWAIHAPSLDLPPMPWCESPEKNFILNLSAT